MVFIYGYIVGIWVGGQPREERTVISPGPIQYAGPCSQSKTRSWRRRVGFTPPKLDP